jgi:hypothetical protein
MVHFSSLLTAVTLTSTILAHPGEHHDHAAIKREIVARNQMANAAARSIGSCSGSLKARDVQARSIARRTQVMHDLRKRQNIKTSKLLIHEL